MKYVITTLLSLWISHASLSQTLLTPNGESPGASSANGRVEINGSNGSGSGRQFKVFYGSGGNLLNAEFSALAHVPTLLNGNGWTSFYVNKGNAQKAGVFNGDVSFFNGKVGIGLENPNSTLELVGNIGSANGRNFKVTYSGGGDLANTEFSALTHISHIPDMNGWTAMYAKQGSAKKAGVFDGDVSVNGNIHTKEVKVDLNGWSDFVFENDYELRTLEEVEEHINENGHLPEIPSETEVNENGINLGEMNAKLLQKIEELTLYLIEEHKNNKELTEKVERLEKELNILKNE